MTILFTAIFTDSPLRKSMFVEIDPDFIPNISFKSTKMHDKHHLSDSDSVTDLEGCNTNMGFRKAKHG